MRFGESDSVVLFDEPNKGKHHVDEWDLVVDIEENIDVALDISDYLPEYFLWLEDEFAFRFLETIVEGDHNSSREDKGILLLTHLDNIVFYFLGKSTEIDPLAAFDIIPAKLVVEQFKLASAAFSDGFEKFEDLLHGMGVVDA